MSIGKFTKSQLEDMLKHVHDEQLRQWSALCRLVVSAIEFEKVSDIPTPGHPGDDQRHYVWLEELKGAIAEAKQALGWDAEE